MDYQALIEDAVEKKLSELDGVPVGLATGRRMELGAKDPSKIRDIYRRSFTDIAERLGLHFFEMTPVVALDQLVVVSVTKNQDTAGLVKSLINSFLVAYVTPETHQRAYDCLEGLEALRTEVSTRRRQLLGTALN